MLAGAVIDAVRDELTDNVEGVYRWTDEHLYRYLTQAQRDVQQYRPDFFLQADDTMATLVEVTSRDTVLTVDDAAFLALAHNVCAQCLASDGADKANIERGGEYMGRFLEIMVGVT